MILRHHNGAYFCQDVPAIETPRLIDLGWTRHPSGPGVWFTRSPYLAAPLWALRDKNDAATRDALASYAWNYETSFAREALAGTGVDSLRAPLSAELFPFQIAGVQRGMLRPKMMLCDEPGLGKSVQSLLSINTLRPNRVLIGCPTFLTENWVGECEKWLVDPQAITVLDGAKKTLPEKGIVILPYSRAHTFDKQLRASGPFDYLIADEFHYLKDHLARRAQPFVSTGGVIERTKRAVLLTGTPIPNNPAEFYAPLKALAPEVLGGLTRQQFQDVYCQTTNIKLKISGREKTIQKITGKGHEALNAELRASGVMVRRLKSEVLTQLPPKNVYFVHLRPDGALADLVKEEASLYDQLQMKIMTAQELIALRGHIANVRNRLGVLKAPHIAAYCQYLFDSGEDRVVLFMLHLEAIELIRRAFEASDVVTHVLTGAVPPSERMNRVKDFQTPGGRKLVIGQVTAAGEGLTMTASRYAVLGEISWTPGKNEQCADRVHRISQTKQVDIPVVAFPHSCEERVIRVNARKSIDAHEILDVNLQSMYREAAE